MEKTLVLIKPDGVKRNLIGEIIARCERKGYKVVNLRFVEPSRELLAKHYAEHEGKSFYEPLMDFMSSGPIVAIALEGQRVIEGYEWSWVLSLISYTVLILLILVQFWDYWVSLF